VTESDHPELPSAQPADRAELCDAPTVLTNDFISGHDFPPNRKQEGNGVIGNLLDAVVGHVGHGDARGASCLEVDVVHSDPVARDYLAALEGGDRIRVDRGVGRQDGIGLGGLCPDRLG